MRPALFLALAIPALALSACSKQEETPQSPEEIKAGMDDLAQAAKPQPGKYRTTIKVTKVEIPGVPAAESAKMQGMFGASGQSTEYCMTQAMADKGFEEWGKQAGKGNCKYDRMKIDGGTMDAVLTCEVGQGMSSRTELKGSFTATGSDLKMKTETSGAGMPGGTMKMEAEMASQRIGDC